MTSNLALARQQRVDYLALLEQQDRRKRHRKFYDYFPDEGPLPRELYAQHLEFFRLGATHGTRCFMAANLDAERASRRQFARAHGLFDESSERPAFEDWFRESRAGKGTTFISMALSRHPDSRAEYQMESTQLH